MRKPEVFEYVDSSGLMDKEITCKFDVDYGYRETRWEPGDPGGLYITEAICDGADILDDLSEKAVETLTELAEVEFYTEQAEREIERAEFEQAHLEDVKRLIEEELLEKHK
jgi:hypothetical protein